MTMQQPSWSNRARSVPLGAVPNPAANNYQPAIRHPQPMSAAQAPTPNYPQNGPVHAMQQQGVQNRGQVQPNGYPSPAAQPPVQVAPSQQQNRQPWQNTPPGPAPQQRGPAPVPQPQAAQYQHGSAQPSPQYPAPNPSQASPPAQQVRISQKIWKINGKDKVVDFVSKLTKANVEDFAMLHGCGGKAHAPNSTIGITLCDYTKGTGDASVTVRYSVDVEDMALLYNAAVSARLGNLRPSSAPALPLADALITQIKSWKGFPLFNDENRSRQVPGQAINAIMDAAIGIRKALQDKEGEPAFTYTREKINPYKTNPQNGFHPASRLQINFTPIRKGGQVSTYPWYISIENFDAPMNTKSTGATTFDGSKAVNKTSAYINLSMEDFLAAMVAVDRHVRLWEIQQAGPVMRMAYKQLDEERMAREQQQDSSRRVG